MTTITLNPELESQGVRLAKRVCVRCFLLSDQKDIEIEKIIGVDEAVPCESPLHREPETI